MPETIVVSIDYSVPNNREEIGLNSSCLSLTKGGVAFQSYIESELIPAVEQQYGTPLRKAIMGYSYTATYLMTLMLNKPSLFDSYIMISPEQTSIPTKEIVQNIATNSNNESRVVCVAAQNDIKERIKAAKEFSSYINKFKVGVSHYKLIPDVNHATVLTSAVGEAMTLLFSDYINELYLVKNYSSKGSLSTTTEELIANSNKHNLDNYGVPLKLNSGNMIFLMDRVLELEHNEESAMIILEPFVDKAIQEEDLLQINNIASYLTMQGNELRADSLYRWAITKSRNPENIVTSLNVRWNYARVVLARKESNYEEAWRILDTIVSDMGDNYLGIVLFFKGEISAKYNYNNEQGIEFLKSAYDYMNDLSLWGINQSAIRANARKKLINLHSHHSNQMFIRPAADIALSLNANIS
ncbi:MAG: hypothetical protein R3Y44_06765, partial [Rikenellaceae bacterium]